MIGDQSEEDFNPFRWAAHFTFVSPGPILHDCLKAQLLEDIGPAIGPDFDDSVLPAIQPLPAELLDLINSIDISNMYSFLSFFCSHNKKECDDVHDRMTTAKLKETPIDFASNLPSTPKRVVLKFGSSQSSPHPSFLSPVKTEVPVDETFEIAKYQYAEENSEDAESFLWELSTKVDPWTPFECQEASSCVTCLIAKIKGGDWMPQQLNVEALLRRALENLDVAEIEAKNGIFGLFEKLIVSQISLSDSIITSLFSTLLSHIRIKRALSCSKSIIDHFHPLETQLLIEFWNAASAVSSATNTISIKNACAECFSNLLLHFLQIRYLHKPETITEFTQKLADDFVEFILEKKHLEIVTKFCQQLFNHEMGEKYCPFTLTFSERFQKLLLAVLSGKLDLASKSFAIDRLYDVVLGCSASSEEWQRNLLSQTNKIANVLIKLISEDSAIIRLKSLKMLHTLSEFPGTSSQIKNSIPAILIRCFQDPSVMLKETAIELLLEQIAKHGLSNSDLLDSLAESCLRQLSGKLLSVVQYLIGQNVPQKYEILGKLLEQYNSGTQSDECIEFLKESWIKPIVQDESFMQQLVDTFALVPQPYCLLEFVKKVEQDPVVGRQFSKASENIVDNLIEKLLDENSPKTDPSINNIMQSLLVFCYGRYEVLSPHLSVLCHYAFDAKFSNTALTACHLLSLLVDGSSTLTLKQQPRIVEKISKAIVQSSEQMIPYLLKCLSVFEGELGKLVEKFKNYLSSGTDSSASATCRSLLVLGHCGKYYSALEKILNPVLHWIACSDVQVQTYAQLAFCLSTPQALHLMQLDARIFGDCLESGNTRVRKQALKASIESLEALEVKDKESQVTLTFDPKAFNSVRSQVSNTQILIGEALDKITSVKSGDDEQAQLLVVRILGLLLKSAFLNPSLIMPSIIGYGFGTNLIEAKELFIDAYERYSSLVIGAYQKGLQMAFKICASADRMVAEELLNYVMHVKNKWKDMRNCVMSIFGKSKDLEYCRWLLSNIQAAGIVSVHELEMALKLNEHYILPLAEIYYEELDCESDPVIIQKLSFLLQYQKALREFNSIPEGLGKKKGAVHKTASNFIQMLDPSELHKFIEAQNISVCDEPERPSHTTKGNTRKKKRKDIPS